MLRNTKDRVVGVTQSSFVQSGRSVEEIGTGRRGG